MGLQATMPEVVAVFKNKKALALIFVWGWVLGPALGLLIVWLLPLAEPYVICVLIGSLASCGPFLPPMVEKARGDANFAGAFIPLVAVGTVVFMPLIAPLLIKGVTISAGALAKPLFVTLLVPLIIGGATRHYAGTVATKIFPAVRGSAKLSTLLLGRGVPSCFMAVRCSTRRAALPSSPCDNLHGRKGTDNVSIRFRPETESAQRHVAGYAHAQWCSDVRRHPCHSGRGPADPNNGRHVDCMVDCTRSHCSQNIRQAGRKDRCRKYEMSAAHKLFAWRRRVRHRLIRNHNSGLTGPLRRPVLSKGRIQ